jgi:phage head maturation protease
MEIAENRIKITGTVMGVPDRTGDVIFPGAFASKVLRVWEKEGWMDVSHEWDGEPVGMPMKASVVADDAGFETLLLECEFHSTEDAQDARTLTLERIQNGKKVSTSIGFMPDYGDNVKWFDTGEALAKFITDNGYDESKFDMKAIKKLGWCRAIIAIRELFEISLCNVGMHRGAKVDEAKQFSGDRGAPLIDELRMALGAVHRSLDLMELRKAEGGSLGAESLALVQSIHAKASQIIGEGTPAEKSDTAPDAPDLSDQLNSLKLFALSM